MDGETRDSGQSLKILSADFTARLKPQPNLRIRTGAKRPIDLANLGCNKFGKVNRSLRSRSDSHQVHLQTKQKSCPNNKKLMVCYTDLFKQNLRNLCNLRTHSAFDVHPVIFNDRVRQNFARDLFNGIPSLRIVHGAIKCNLEVFSLAYIRDSGISEQFN